MKYRIKPQVVDAIRWDGKPECRDKIEEMVGDAIVVDYTGFMPTIIIPTAYADIEVTQGAWIVKDGFDYIYIVTHNVFEQISEAV